ncbi:hypothetical protein QTI33_32095 [Variovorax sp. J22P271]|uniref:hypothetical protein n=1 Tax=Variovorax davisae TaxID=3053515 RepID=UPI0025782A9C|nr:hypothetical protein [Variovorax sp. J22P271]MDM0036815.1 hypothetical protein [Variovorax sp. J22P271]
MLTKSSKTGYLAPLFRKEEQAAPDAEVLPEGESASVPIPLDPPLPHRWRQS